MAGIEYCDSRSSTTPRDSDYGYTGVENVQLT